MGKRGGGVGWSLVPHSKIFVLPCSFGQGSFAPPGARSGGQGINQGDQITFVDS